MQTDRVMAVAMPLLGAAEAAAALGASLRLHRDGSSIDPELAARLDAVLDVLGVRDAVRGLSEQEAATLLGLVEGFLSQAVDLVVHPDRTTWDHVQPSILMGQGHTSAGIAAIFQRFVVPSLDGALATRLRDAGASFLDVGVGVAALSVAMCRLWPSLRVVGVDPWGPALALARENVLAAGLADRIELRAMAAETLQDTHEYDLAWVPTFFISAALEQVTQRVHAALRPGGWAILGLYVRPDDPLAAAVSDVRTVRQGGTVRTPHEAAALLTRTGFVDVDVLANGRWRLPLVFVAGRRRG